MVFEDTPVLDRRRLVAGASSLAAAFSGLAGCATVARAPQGRSVAFGSQPIAKLGAETDRIFDITVCTRPLRAAGPRLDTEQIGDTLIVHNYGHGGSG